MVETFYRGTIYSTIKGSFQGFPLKGSMSTPRNNSGQSFGSSRSAQGPRSYPSILPQEWYDVFFKKADLDAAYDLLVGRPRHFLIEATRGHVRSLQLRFDEAWEHLDRAVDMSEEAEETIPNLVRRFLLEITRFETALFETPVHPSTEFLSLEMPQVDPAVFSEYPEVKQVLDKRKVCEGKLLLHLGKCEEAAAIFEDLKEQNPSTTPEALAVYYLNLGACQHSMGLFEEAQRNLENAEFAVAAIETRLNAVRVGSTLHTFFYFMGDGEKAAEWLAYVQRLDCPQKTKDLFVKIGKRLYERCLEHSRLVAW